LNFSNEALHLRAPIDCLVVALLVPKCERATARSLGMAYTAGNDHHMNKQLAYPPIMQAGDNCVITPDHCNSKRESHLVKNFEYKLLNKLICNLNKKVKGEEHTKYKQSDII
jgi:hypothetical protein